LARESVHGHAKALLVETFGHHEDLCGGERVRYALGGQHEQFGVKGLGHVRDAGEVGEILPRDQEVDPSGDMALPEMGEAF
jgi:hypothetical protein